MLPKAIASTAALLVLACGQVDASGGGGSETGFVETRPGQPCPDGEVCAQSDSSRQSGSEPAPSEQVAEPIPSADPTEVMDPSPPSGQGAASCDDAELVEGIDRSWVVEWSADGPLYPLAGCGDESNPPGSEGVVVKWVAPADAPGEVWAFASYGTFFGVLQGPACASGLQSGATETTSGACGLFGPADDGSPGGGGFKLAIEPGEELYFTVQFLDPEGGEMPSTGTVELFIGNVEGLP